MNYYPFSTTSHRIARMCNGRGLITPSCLPIISIKDLMSKRYARTEPSKSTLNYTLTLDMDKTNKGPYALISFPKHQR